MYEQKTKPTDSSVIEFIEQIDHPRKKEDAYRLLDLFTETTGREAVMWGPAIIGFGKYHYKYATGHGGDAPLVGFSPRKAKISLYVTVGNAEREPLLCRLGKHTSGKSCVYVNKLEDIDQDVLKEIILSSIATLEKAYPDGIE
ncbi:DUF1801 domain-containing protein [Bhargavaea beijingensis]|uniref:DUF1801 domain-containing protein n=1 Tax=Bhargavaea beijingensis TaxID=426756 RepID=A0A1G7GH59_9BACL|nr:DUF1801 domain-containing protein [Bhargavaea beijingensis]RSK29727.1 DUF1801 domain-containing protein [Bhargavaea beijingensis]SDE87431.1 protein of unknown function (DU1801) [Bhargavaea beijingensis]